MPRRRRWAGLIGSFLAPGQLSDDVIVEFMSWSETNFTRERRTGTVLQRLVKGKSLASVFIARKEFKYPKVPYRTVLVVDSSWHTMDPLHNNSERELGRKLNCKILGKNVRSAAAIEQQTIVPQTRTHRSRYLSQGELPEGQRPMFSFNWLFQNYWRVLVFELFFP